MIIFLSMYLKVSLLSILLFYCTQISFTQTHGDCATAYWVCNSSSPLHFEGATGEGKKMDATFVSCFMEKNKDGQSEKNASWLRFEIDSACLLTFTITPDKTSDDIDFVLFKLPQNRDCTYKSIFRCMAADNSDNEPISPCRGATGLMDGDLDTSEDSSCGDKDDNNWLAACRVSKGEQYVLLVSNQSGDQNGFTISLGGGCMFKCPVQSQN